MRSTLAFLSFFYISFSFNLIANSSFESPGQEGSCGNSLPGDFATLREEIKGAGKKVRDAAENLSQDDEKNSGEEEGEVNVTKILVGLWEEQKRQEKINENFAAQLKQLKAKNSFWGHFFQQPIVPGSAADYIIQGIMWTVITGVGLGLLYVLGSGSVQKNVENSDKCVIVEGAKVLRDFAQNNSAVFVQALNMSEIGLPPQMRILLGSIVYAMQQEESQKKMSKQCEAFGKHVKKVGKKMEKIEDQVGGLKKSMVVFGERPNEQNGGGVCVSKEAFSKVKPGEEIKHEDVSLSPRNKSNSESSGESSSSSSS